MVAVVAAIPVCDSGPILSQETTALSCDLGYLTPPSRCVTGPRSCPACPRIGASSPRIFARSCARPAR